MKLKKSIIFQLDAELKKTADERLDSIGMSMSEYLRRCLMSLIKDQSTLDVTRILDGIVKESSKGAEGLNNY